ncbi:hypothetical protein C7380_10312 [Oceanotoga teriensis]|uniref:Uncharacterized protein n=2 Tax=Petrotogaceae TaxID=1643949 RepID=A0AA45C823_9BACT|nr:hypothetical protein C7380_10312 [Oceanotoga teriensis]
MNIIFDIGNVLLKFNPENILENYPVNDRKKLR